MRRICLSILACASLGLGACGGAHQPSTSQLDYVRLSSNSWGLSRRIHQTAITICIKGVNTEEHQKTAALALRSWLRSMRFLDSTVTDGVEFSCDSPNITMNWNSGSGRAYTNPAYDTPTMTLFSNSEFRTVHHELGHAFGLGDTYSFAGRYYEPELTDTKGNGSRPDSVMKLGRYGKAPLYADDIEGIQSILMQLAASNGTTYGAEEACTTTNGQAGVRRPMQHSLTGESEYSACRPTKAYEQYNYEPTMSPCSSGSQTYGLYDVNQDEWLPGLQSTYACQ